LTEGFNNQSGFKFICFLDKHTAPKPKEIAPSIRNGLLLATNLFYNYQKDFVPLKLLRKVWVN